MTATPEAKTVKNRVHLDILVGSAERAALVDRLLAVGGRVVRTFPRFAVMADPEGNELCLTDG